jgi:outer membrane protein TolC
MSFQAFTRRLLLVAIFASASGHAAPDPSSDAPLTLADAVRLSLSDQPLLLERSARIEAEQQQSIAAGQLPDPKLTGGIRDLPVDGGEAFSPRRDDFTVYSVGLSQDFPRGDRRRLGAQRLRLEADTDRSALDDDRRRIGRDAALAWLDVYEAETAFQLSRQLETEAGLQVEAAAADYANGRLSQAAWLAARVDAGLIGDKAHDWYHRSLRLRAVLARWIGDADARRRLPETLPQPGRPDDLPQLLAAADRHPLVEGLEHQIESAATGIALAKQAYKPDLSVEGYVAYRPDYADFVGLQLSIDLPYFTRNRQDRQLAAAVQQATASEERRRDVLRELHAQVMQEALDVDHYRQRVDEFDSSILPDAQRRAETARSAYESGRGDFDAVLAARRGLLDAQLQRLALAVEAARAAVRLHYLVAPSDRPGEAS